MTTINATGAIKPRHGGALTPVIEARLRERIEAALKTYAARDEIDFDTISLEIITRIVRDTK